MANIALSVLDEHFAARWAALGPEWTRAKRRRAGQPVMKLVRYADDFVVLLHGQRGDADALWDDVAVLLAPMGLCLSVAKTRVCHIDNGFDFLGWRIQRRRWTGPTGKKEIYTYPSKKALASVVGKVRTLTRRAVHRPESRPHGQAPPRRREHAESRMRWKSHVRFGRRAAETDQSKDRQRAAARPHTEHPTAEGTLYLCAIKDVHSGLILGYSMDARMTASLAVTALRNSIALRAPVGTIVHSDRAVPLDHVRPHGEEQRVGRLDGPRRRLRGQRRDGVLLRPAAEEHSRPAALGHP